MTLSPRQIKEAREVDQLACYASLSSKSLGRVFGEGRDPVRTCYERDRDRVVHSAAFRRLMYKTQVFLNEEGDEHRTRLSHSLEVAQVARTLASGLNLNEALAEALALSHDIGHPAFGHRGEVALHDLMEGFGGFRHNNQVLRVVDLLERRSPDYSGLNLTREVRESLLKHESAADWPAEFESQPQQPRLEAQVTDMADSTAYNKHDIEDGLTAGMFTEQQIFDEVALWRRSVAAVEERHPGFLAASKDPKLRVQRIANELIGSAIGDLLAASAAGLAQASPGSVAEVQKHPGMLIRHSEEFAKEAAELSRFLHKRFYRHEHLQRFLVFARHVLSGLFEAYLEKPSELPEWYRDWAEDEGLHRAICDFLAGMTDRFALREYERLVGTLPQGFQPRVRWFASR